MALSLVASLVENALVMILPLVAPLADTFGDGITNCLRVWVVVDERINAEVKILPYSSI